MRRLQVKYCTSEKELNEFLTTLNVDSTSVFPRLHNINYIVKPEGEGTVSGEEGSATVGAEVIAIVQYFVEESEKVEE